MNKSRLEAFSDGVIAVIITIMVLELKPPHGETWSDLSPLISTFVVYVLSFVFVGIYWVNHHHFFQIINKISSRMLWANNHLLFWLSLIPFTTAWMGETHLAKLPVALYALNLLCCALAYTILSAVALQVEGSHSPLAKAMGEDRKGKISLALYVVALPVAFFAPYISCLLFAVVAIIWLVPDQRIERVMR